MSETPKNPMIPEEDSPSLSPAEPMEHTAEECATEELAAPNAASDNAPAEEGSTEEASGTVDAAEEVPAVEASEAEAPAVETPDAEAPMVETSDAEAPMVETSDAEASAVEEAKEATPMANISVEASPAASSHEEAPSPKVAPADPPPRTTYRWTYADQVKHDRKKSGHKKRSGVLVYTLVMCLVFLISFSMLISVLLLGSLSFRGGSTPSILRPGISDPANDDEAVEGVEQAKRSVVVIEVTTATGGGTGTGIIMTDNGYIATNHHVIEDGERIKVTFYDGSYALADIVGSSEMDDLAVIKVNKSGLPAATFARSEECYVGQTVYAIGAPAGPEFGWTTTRGIISYKDREVKMYDDSGSLQKKLRLIQTDANVNPGNSGGPLINTKGEVVGVVSMKLADGYEGIGFAIPSDGAVEILDAIMEHGHANDINSSISHKRPMMGITGVYMEGGVTYVFTDTGVDRVTEDEMDQYDESELYCPPVSGVYVMALTEGLDAANRLEIGDIITAIDGEDIFSMNDLTETILDHNAGETVVLSVYRDGLKKRIRILLSAA